ncbi:MAG: hypothetical protein R3Y13_05435 [bacterium]
MKVLVDSKQNNNKSLVKINSYYCINNLCGIIEKILRCIYIDSKIGVEYINEDSITLGTYVKSLDSMFEKIDLNFIEYCMLHRGGVGENIRNIVSHYKDDIYGVVNGYNVDKLLFVLILIINNISNKNFQKEKSSI